MDYFNKDNISELYPEAEDMMLPAMLIWKLPAGKEDKLSEVCENGDYFLEEKVDGAFYQFVKTPNHSYLFGRTVSRKTGLLTEKGANVPHIIDALSAVPADTAIVGEIYVPGGTSKDVTSIMGCLPEKAIARQKDNPIHFYLHDITFYNGEDVTALGAEDRYDLLHKLWDECGLAQYGFLKLAEKVTENLEQTISDILARGGEGAVLKKKDAPYTPDKRPAWSTVKIKQMDSIDLVCMGFCSPTKEYTGKELETWPYWVKMRPVFYDCFEEDNCFGGYDEEFIEGQYFSSYIPSTLIIDPITHYVPVTKYYFYGWYSAIKIGAYDNNGTLVELGTVSSGLTDEMKQSMSENPLFYLGMVVSLDCMSIDKGSKTLRHPVFKAWRGDKNPEDCKISEVFA